MDNICTSGTKYGSAITDNTAILVEYHGSGWGPRLGLVAFVAIATCLRVGVHTLLIDERNLGLKSGLSATKAMQRTRKVASCAVVTVLHQAVHQRDAMICVSCPCLRVLPFTLAIPVPLVPKDTGTTHDITLAPKV